MSLVATLVCNPEDAALDAALARRAAAATGAARIDWLCEAVACDLHLPPDLEGQRAQHLLREAAGRAPVDIIVQPRAGRRKKMLIADMDSTMIEQECIDELADVVGIGDAVAEITARAMNGEIAFEPALRERVALLEGLETTTIARVIEERITLARGGRELVATMNAAGAWTVLVSGGFDVFAAPIAARLGFGEYRANGLGEADGKLTGQVAEPVLGRAAKAAALVEIAGRLGLAHAEILAVGDGANDLDMIRMAGAGIALHAKPAVAAAAPVRIDHGDLTALLYLQGYSKSDFVD